MNKNSMKALGALTAVFLMFPAPAHAGTLQDFFKKAVAVSKAVIMVPVHVVVDATTAGLHAASDGADKVKGLL